jgi:hypothetical protein
MRDLRELDHLRAVTQELQIYGSLGGSYGGCFFVGKLAIIASSGDGWDHVSVSLADRLPTWDEMEKVKRTFFKDEECAFQLHVPVDEYIDGIELGKRARYCLHLWRPTTTPIPRPPDWMVGNRSQVQKLKREGKL